MTNTFAHRIMILIANLKNAVFFVLLRLFLISILVCTCESVNAFASTEVGGSINTNTTWTASGSPYIITNGILVEAGSTLTIDSGVTVNTGGHNITINGTLNLNGGTIEPGSYLSSYSCGYGHTCFYSNYSTITVGDGGHINFQGGTIIGGTLDIVISSGGMLNLSDSTWNGSSGTLWLNSGSSGTITGNYIDWRVYLNEDNYTINGNTFNCNSSGTCVTYDGDGSAVIDNNNFMGSSSVSGIYNETTNTINAKYNYWGDLSGPTHGTNPNGKGVSISDYVDYGDWLTWPVGQPMPLGPLDHFEFSTISSPQSVSVPFSITLTAKDAYGNSVDYSGSVALWSNAGSVSPVNIYLANGTWTGNVTLYEAGCNTHLGASVGGKSGLSDDFAVTGPGATAGSLQGVVKDGNGNAISGASVCLLQDKVGSCVYSTTTTNGNYQFNGTGCCQYYVYATYNNAQSHTYEVNVPCGRTVTEDLTVSSCNPDGRIPILLVPGIMGSTINRNLPVLSNEVYDWDSGKLSIFDSDATGYGWAHIKDILKNAGYTENCTLFDVPYDWRMHIDDIAKKYLKPWIDEAKQKAGNVGKVNIIAHSMGGLVARAYIQGDNYENDVERLAMVGTPNHGAAVPYYLWQGGDPLAADRASKNIIPTYSLLTSINYLATHQFSISELEQMDYYDFIHNHIPTTEELMPIYDFLLRRSSISSGLECDNNEWLEKLNDESEGTVSRLGKADDPDNNKVKTKLFIGDENNTVANIWVGKKHCSDEVYPDGTPLGGGPLTLWQALVDMSPDGDGTVLTSSASLGDGVSYASSKQGEHPKLIDVFKDDIVSFMAQGVTAARTASQKSLPLTPTNSVSLTISGRVEPYIHGPGGQESGIKNNVRINDIPDHSCPK